MDRSSYVPLDNSSYYQPEPVEHIFLTRYYFFPTPLLISCETSGLGLVFRKSLNFQVEFLCRYCEIFIYWKSTRNCFLRYCADSLIEAEGSEGLKSKFLINILMVNPIPIMKKNSYNKWVILLELYILLCHVWCPRPRRYHPTLPVRDGEIYNYVSI